MSSRLRKVGGGRLVHLRYSDAPRVAQAILDAMEGRAQVVHGVAGDTHYLQFVRKGGYKITIRKDDWLKIFPFVRYSTKNFTPVIPPGNKPAAIPSPQPNRLMQVPPESPDDGLTSFMEGLPYDEYRKVQELMTTLSLGTYRQDVLQEFEENPPALYPLEKDFDGPVYHRDIFFRLVYVLQRLFPTDFPTTF